MSANLYDHCGNAVRAGDIVVVVHADASRGAQASMFLERASVIDLGRSRAVLRLWSRSGTWRVGCEALRVVQAGDGRDLMTPSQAWERDHPSVGTKELRPGCATDS